MRTLVIGLDGVCLPVLDPLIKEGEVPNIETLSGRSAVAPLKSQLPPWTPSAWPSIYTGVNPGKHGVYDFLHFDGYNWDVVNRSLVKEFAVWELLSQHELTSVIVNVPVTHPSREFDGALVPGYTAPEGADCHPDGVWTELVHELGEYRLYSEASSANKRERIAEYDRLVEMRGAAFRYLAEKYDPDFGFVQFQQCDTVFHDFPGEAEVVQTVFSAIDREIGDILDACDPDVTLLVSDHGIGPIDGCEFRINNFLRDKGFATTTPEGGGMPSWQSISRKRLREGEESGPVEQTPAERAIELLARMGITSQRMAAVVKRLGIEDFVLKVTPDDIIRAGGEQVDFESSIAYMRSRTEMGVRINLEGREPVGNVSPSEYERVRKSIIDALNDVTTPAGERVFEAVLPREEVFDGPYVEDAPDVVTVPNNFDHYLSSNLKESRFSDPIEPWEHKLNGVVMIAGDDVEENSSLLSPHIFDITPTILATFGLSVGERMDGRPLEVVEPTGRVEYPSFEPNPVHSTNDKDVEQRLSDLGYLE